MASFSRLVCQILIFESHTFQTLRRNLAELVTGMVCFVGLLNLSSFYALFHNQKEYECMRDVYLTPRGKDGLTALFQKSNQIQRVSSTKNTSNLILEITNVYR